MTVLEIAVGLVGVLQPVLLGLLIRSLSRLTAIEVALGLRESPDAREGRALQIREQARMVCASEHKCAYQETTGVKIQRLDPTHPGGA